ncbi:MAG TPA: hypothetical protein ENO00_04955 [Deltaproteobacteria bacterium]|nr:hypothetical protein [Deltaproteobacteria bacterium]
MNHDITLTETIRKRIDDRGGDMSATIRHDLEQYYALLYFVGEEMRGYFSIDEASHLCDVFRSTSMDIQRLKSWPSFLAWDVEEVEKYEKLGVGAVIEIERLIDKLEKLTIVQALWVWDSIRLFWKTGSHAESKSETLKTLFRTGR